MIASRANGALSRGPKTEEGKRRSSANAMRHGLLSKCVVLPGESQEIFSSLLEQHLAKLEPADGVEHGVVEEMVASVWRLRRLWAVENRLMSQAMDKRTETDELDRIAGAFSDLSRQPELHLIQRYEGRLHNMYQRSLHNLFIFGAVEASAETSDYQTNLDSDKPIEIKPLEA